MPLVSTDPRFMQSHAPLWVRISLLTALLLTAPVPFAAAQTIAATLSSASAATPSSATPSSATASADLPDAPSALLASTLSSSSASPDSATPDISAAAQDSPGSSSSSTTTAAPQTPTEPNKPAAPPQQPKRILGLMPNYRTVSSGVRPPPPTFRNNFMVATHQSLDYSTFIFLLATTATAYGEDAHPSLDTTNGGNAVFYAYLWRGFLDKTDQTYQSAWILPSLLHEDTRYYAMGHGPFIKRLAYAVSRVAIARTYSGHNTPNIAGLGGKAGAQAVSTTYYPSGATDFGSLATKFGYSCMRDIGFTVFREFYPDIAVHVLHRKP